MGACARVRWAASLAVLFKSAHCLSDGGGSDTRAARYMLGSAGRGNLRRLKTDRFTHTCLAAATALYAYWRELRQAWSVHKANINTLWPLLVCQPKMLAKWR